MKKIIIIAALVVVGIGSYAQGNVSVAGAVGGVWNNYTTPGTPVTTAGGFYVSLLFAPDNSVSALSAISSTGSATNGTTSYSATTAWNDISSDLSSGWFVLDGTSGSALSIAASGPLKGTFSYNSGSSWAAANITAGTTYEVYEIAWASGYTTEAAALAADAYVGWSTVFTYTPTSGANQPTAISPGNNVGYYSIGGAAATPEPTTIALAGLGIAGLVALRRKK